MLITNVTARPIDAEGRLSLAMDTGRQRPPCCRPAELPRSNGESQGEWRLGALVESGQAPVVPEFTGAGHILDAEYIDRDPKFRMYSVSGRYLDGNQDLQVVGAVDGGDNHLYVLNEASAQWSRTGPLSIWLNVNAANREGVLYQLSLSAPDPTQPIYEGFLLDSNTLVGPEIVSERRP